MPDIADDHAAFREAMARAEAASGIERDADGNEINGIESIVRGETPDVTELEGAAPVPASDPPTPEPVTPPEPTATSEEQVAPAAPTVEELQAKLEATQARLEEKDTFIGRQSGEVGELRLAVEEMQRQIQAQPVTPAPTIQVTQELIDNNPAAAVQAAFAQRDEQALQIAFEAWKDPLHPEGDPFAAASWLNERKLEQQQAAFDARLAETEKKFETATAPLAADAAANADQQQWKTAFDTVKATRPDFLENAERLLTEVAPQFPAFTAMLANGDAEAKATALAALYSLDKLGNPEAVQAQLAEAATEAATEAAAALAAAKAVSGQTTVKTGTEEATTEELEAAAYVARQKGKPSLSRGWTGRS